MHPRRLATALGAQRARRARAVCASTRCAKGHRPSPALPSAARGSMPSSTWPSARTRRLPGPTLRYLVNRLQYGAPQ
jgi:hypothetical protein